MSIEQNKEEYLPLPSSFQELLTTFMRTIKAGRLYSSGHVLFKQNAEKLHGQILEAMEHHGFLFLGIAKDALFLKGSFYQGQDSLFRSFVDFFHALGVSHLLLKKDLILRELEAFVVFLAGANSGQGEEVQGALLRENINQISLGLLNSRIFSCAHAVAMQVFPPGDDASAWRQLILQPAGLGNFNLDPEKLKAIVLLSEHPDELNQMIHQFDREMIQQVEGISVSQRSVLLANFLQNLSSILAGMGAQKKQEFSKQVESALKSLDAHLRTQILGSLPPDLEGDDTGLFQDILVAIPDQQFLYLLLDALKHSGPVSACFIHLFKRAVLRYKAAKVLLDLIRSEMNRVTHDRQGGSLNLWQQLEQFVVRHQETEEFNAQYQRAIEDLETSLKIQQPMIEQEEMARLRRTLDSEFLNLSKAHLLLDLLSHTHSSKEGDLFLLPLLASMGDIVRGVLAQGKPRLLGNLLRQIFLSLNRFPKEKVAREVIYSWLRLEEVQEVLKGLVEKCRTYSSQETASLTAVCQLYPEKAGGYLIELFLSLDDSSSDQYQWTLTTLASIAPRLTRVFNRQFQKISETRLPGLIELVGLIMDEQMAPAVEEFLGHKDYAVRSTAVRTLGQLKAGNSVDRLREILADRSWIMRRKAKSLQMEAARALAEIGTVEAKAILHQVASERTGDLQTLCNELLLAWRHDG